MGLCLYISLQSSDQDLKKVSSEYLTIPCDLNTRLVRYSDPACIRNGEYLPVPLPHAFRMWRSDVLINNLLPPSSTKPPSEKALNFFDLGNVGILSILITTVTILQKINEI